MNDNAGETCLHCLLLQQVKDFHEKAGVHECAEDLAHDLGLFLGDILASVAEQHGLDHAQGFSLTMQLAMVRRAEGLIDARTPSSKAMN